MIQTLRTFAVLFLLAGFLGIAGSLYKIFVNPTVTYIRVTGTITQKYVGEKCYGVAGNNTCVDAPYIEYVFQTKEGETVAAKTEATCLNWDAIEPGASVYVGYSPRNPRSRKACDQPIEDPFAFQPWMYLFLSVFSIFGGIGCFRAAANEAANRKRIMEGRKKVKSFSQIREENETEAQTNPAPPKLPGPPSEEKKPETEN